MKICLLYHVKVCRNSRNLLLEPNTKLLSYVFCAFMSKYFKVPTLCMGCAFCRGILLTTLVRASRVVKLKGLAATFGSCNLLLT
jgi:hypothetical protein